MLSRIKLPFLFLVISSFLSSCAIYYPQTTEIPLIQEKGELQVAGGATALLTLNSTISYGLSNKLSVQAYGNTWLQAHNFYTQGALGYYGKGKNTWSYELYTGMGYGEGGIYGW